MIFTNRMRAFVFALVITLLCVAGVILTEHSSNFNVMMTFLSVFPAALLGAIWPGVTDKKAAAVVGAALALGTWATTTMLIAYADLGPNADSLELGSPAYWFVTVFPMFTVYALGWLILMTSTLTTEGDHP